jgi:hypothetical protein
MDAYDLVEIGALSFLCLLGVLLVFGAICLIIHYLGIIAEHYRISKQAKEIDAEKIAKNIYGEDQ